MNKIINCKIKSTTLGIEDHGIFTFSLHLEGHGWGCGFGGYSLDEYDKKTERRILTAKGAGSIQELLRVLEVSSWEKLSGSFIRADSEGLGGGICRVGHLMKDQWFDPREYFATPANDGEPGGKGVGK